MARKAKKKPAAKKRQAKSVWWRVRPLRWLAKWALRFLGGLAALALAGILLFSVVNPPTTPYIFAEGRRLGDVDRQWLPIEKISPFMARAVVAAEDANFCVHWGFDIAAIREAIDGGNGRGGSTISQQVVKNVYLWQGRSWPRKALEALMTPMLEIFWSKRRIVEVYLNVVEFDTGVFGVDAASYRYFGIGADRLSAAQAARLAAVLPDPKARSAANPTKWLAGRAGAIADGAATIQADGRATCFES